MKEWSIFPLEKRGGWDDLKNLKQWRDSDVNWHEKTDTNVQDIRAIILPLGFTRNLEHAGAYTSVPPGWGNVR